MTKRWIVQEKTPWSGGWFDTKRYRWFLAAAFAVAGQDSRYHRYRVVDSRTYDYDNPD